MCIRDSDESTGLLWAVRNVLKDWDDAKQDCEDFVACGRSDWRMPNIDEYREVIVGCAATMIDGVCPAHDGMYSGCWDTTCDSCPLNMGPDGCYAVPGLPGACWPGPQQFFWSSSTCAYPMTVSFMDGSISSYDKPTVSKPFYCVSDVL